MTLARTTAASLVSLAGLLSSSMAFAQATPTDAAADPAAATASTPAQTAPAAGSGNEPRQLTWADVDIDGSGAISKEESGQLPSLAQVFADADADADGELTPDEYKAYVATVGGGASQGGGSH